MNLTRLALSNGHGVLVAALLILLFGAIAFSRLPIQLTPEVMEPEITITTRWRAAAPNEVEAEIIEPQEDVLRGLPGMTELLAKAQQGRAEITITFQVDMDIRRALLEILSRLNQVARYPDDADEPVISTAGGGSRAIAWFIIKTREGNKRNITSYQDYVKEMVQTRFERVPGVARSEIFGGRDTEIRISFDPYKAAALGIQLPMASELAGSGQDLSGGFADVGKREYTVRFEGTYQVDELGELIIDWRAGKPVHLSDVAVVERRLVDRTSFVITDGSASVAVNAQRETGVNVLQVMQGLKAAAEELNQGTLSRTGLSMEQVYDETVYIHRAIQMLRGNLGMGICLAVAVLWWFLRKFRATLMVAAAIPLCLLGSFLVLFLGNRTLNIISLAGLAFAMGMVLDAAIVVLENIVRLRERGEPADQAAAHGASQVWGALLASTATTVAIFLPIVFLQDEVGQLFADLALTITAAIIVSLLVAVTVIPAVSTHWLKDARLEDPHQHGWQAVTRLIMRWTNTPRRRLTWIAVLIGIPALLTWRILPKADYLPEGNRNLVFAFILPPPGANIQHLEKELGRVVAARMAPYFSGTKQPTVKNYFFVALPTGVFMGASSEDPSRTNELVSLIHAAVNGFPDTLAFAQQASLFGSLGEGRTVDIDLQGRDIDSLLHAARAGYALISQTLPGASVRPFPGLELAQPELRITPDEQRIARAGWNRATVASIIRALGDGLYVGDYFDGEKTIDIIIRSEPWATPEELESIPLATPRAGIQPLGELVQIQRTAGPNEIRRINRRRTITLQVTPASDQSLEAAIQVLREDFTDKIEPLMPADGDIRYSGTADKLRTAIASMSSSFVLALTLLFLLMGALFRSFLDSLLVPSYT